MKFYFASVLLLIFAIQFTTAQWGNVDLTGYGQAGILPYLQGIGLSYVQQKGVFESTKSPFPAKYYISEDIEKLERRNTSEVTYYRWTLILKEQYDNQDERGDSAVRTTFTVSYRPSNNNFVVTDYKYTTYPDGYTIPVDENEEEFVSDETPNQITWTLLDLRPLNDAPVISHLH